MYAPVLDQDGYRLLIECDRLWGPPFVHVVEGHRDAEIWLDDPVSVRRNRRFSERQLREVLALVQQNLDELTGCWFNLREDVRRGRLEERHALVDTLSG